MKDHWLLRIILTMVVLASTIWCIDAMFHVYKLPRVELVYHPKVQVEKISIIDRNDGERFPFAVTNISKDLEITDLDEFFNHEYRLVRIKNNLSELYLLGMTEDGLFNVRRHRINLSGMNLSESYFINDVYVIDDRNLVFVFGGISFGLFMFLSLLISVPSSLLMATFWSP